MEFRAVLTHLSVLAALSADQALAAPAYPLRAAADGRHLIDQRDRPVFFTADSPWHIIPRLTREQALVYLDDRQQHGFNAILVSLVVTDGYHNGPGTNRYGAAPFLSAGDFATPNEAYFAHADWVLDQARQRDITVFLFPAYGGYACGAEGWCQAMQQNGPAKLREFGRWVGNRYRDQPNIVWMHGGDLDANAFGLLDEVDAVAEGILEVDTEHLHSGHCARFASGLDCYDRPWLDLNTTYADCASTPREVKGDWDRAPARPFVYVEGRYEFEQGAGAACMRAQAYASLLGGAAGHFFGSGSIWDFPAGWENALDSAGSRSLLYFDRLLRSRRWEALSPDYAHTVLTAGYGDIATGSYAPAARTLDGSTVIVYVPTSRTLTIAMDRLAGSFAVGWWYDPATGLATSLGSFRTTGTRDFTPPTAQDWVLVLDSEDANYEAPGRVDIHTPTTQSSFGMLKGSFRPIGRP